LINNQILPFNFENSEIRIILIDNEPWFIAKDIGDILGYTTDSAMSNAKKDLDDDEVKTSFKMKSSDDRIKLYDLVSESGLYSLIIRSRKQIAKPFQKWVTREVLPSIRKTGSYSISQQTPEKSHQTVQVQNDGFDIKLYTQQSREIFELVQLINSQNSKTLYFADNLYKNLNIQSPLELLKINLENYYFIPTELGNFINTSPVETNKILEFKGFQTKQNGAWTLTEKGRSFAIEVQNGSFLQIKWKLKAISE
jgi:prophage antirepressor-like protein